jgi:recombination protein RecA
MAKAATKTAVGLTELIQHINGTAKDAALSGTGSAFLELAQRRQPISTGYLGVDYMFGGGLPVGQASLFYGTPGVGKSSMALHIMASAQQQGLAAGIIDTETSNTTESGLAYMTMLGIDLEKLFIARPLNAEQAIETAQQIVHSGLVDVLLIDSASAMTPGRVLESEADKSNMGLRAARNESLMARINPLAARTGTSVIIIAHEGKTSMDQYGVETPIGGKALRHYSAQHVRFTKKRKPVVEGENPIGREVEMHIQRSKLGASEGTMLDMFYRNGEGFDVNFDLLQAAKRFGTVNEYAKGFFSLLGSRNIHGGDKVVAALEEDADLFVELYAETRKAMFATLAQERADELAVRQVRQQRIAAANARVFPQGNAA